MAMLGIQKLATVEELSIGLSEKSNTGHGHGISDVSELIDALNDKVSAEAGKGLSEDNYTTDEKTKLAGIEAGAQVNPDLTGYVTDSELETSLALKLDASAYVQHFLGKFAAPEALEAAYPTAIDGDYAIIDAGAGEDARNYIWDVDSGWIDSGAVASGTTTDTVTEGSTNLYHTAARVRDVLLTGFSTAVSTAVDSLDSFLTAAGKLQAQILGKQPKIISVTVGTAQATAAKTATVADYTPAAGDWLLVVFTLGNNTNALTLNINGTGALPIYCAGAQAGSGVMTIASGSPVLMYFNGTSYNVTGSQVNTQYTVITTAEIDAGTGTTGRLLSPARLRYAFSNLIATTSLAGSMSAADKVKLDGIEPGAQANQDLSGYATTGQLADKADLVDGKVPASQLPSYVDDVLEYADLAAFPVSGETGKIYIAIDTIKQYRWTGSAYAEIVASPGSTDSVTEGSTNLYFTAGRVREALLTGLSTATSAAIEATDSFLAAMGKLQAQMNEKANLLSANFTALQVGGKNVPGYEYGSNVNGHWMKWYDKDGNLIKVEQSNHESTSRANAESVTLPISFPDSSWFASVTPHSNDRWVGTVPIASSSAFSVVIRIASTGAVSSSLTSWYAVWIKP